VSQRKEKFLHGAAGFERVCLVVETLGGRPVPVGEQARNDTDILGIVDGDTGRGTISKTVRINRKPEPLAGSVNYTDVDRVPA
jgi:hypothetical protein